MNTQGIHNHALVLGLQFGDEGVEHVVDSLISSFDAVVRFNTGLDHRYMPSGITHSGIFNIIAQGVYIDPQILADEVSSFAHNGIGVSEQNLAVSSLSPIIMPWHKVLDSGQGFAYAAADGMLGKSFRMFDLFTPQCKDRFMQEGAFQNDIIALHNKKQLDLEKEYTMLHEAFSRIAPYVTDTYTLLQSLSSQGKRIMFESSGGMTCDPSAVIQGTGICIPTQSIGLIKAYVTCVGLQEMPTEILHDGSKVLRKKGNEYIPLTHEARRIGWFDVPMVKYALVCGVDTIVLTKLEALSDTDEIQICTKYIDVHDDKEVDYIPGNSQYLKDVTTWYESYPSWKQNIQGITEYAKLPIQARTFITALEHHIGKKFTYISTGPRKEDVIIR